MSKTADLEAGALWQTLGSVLVDQGFDPFPTKRMWVRRCGADHYGVVGLRQGRATKTEFAVFFATWSPEMDGLRADGSKDQRRSIKSFGSMFELSPVSPLKNTYWWPVQTLSDVEATQLRRQLSELVLPFFDAAASQQDLNVVVSLEGIATSLLQAGLAEAGFALDGDLLWRRRGPCIDLLAVELLADARFVAVHAAAWHASILEGIDGDIPHGVTMATALPVGGHAVGGDPMDALWFTGASPLARAGLSHMLAEVPGQALRHFSGVQTRAEVLELLPEAYRPYFPRV